METKTAFDTFCRQLGCVPRVRNLPQNFLEVVQELDKVGQAFDVFPQRVRLGWSVALPTQLDGPHERCCSLQKSTTTKKNPAKAN